MQSNPKLNSVKEIQKVNKEPIKNSKLSSTKNVGGIIASHTNQSYFANKVVSNLGVAKKASQKSGDTIDVDYKLSLDICEKEYDKYLEASTSEKSVGIVKSFSVNSYVGLNKKTNEDKVVKVPLIKKPANSIVRNWPKLSYFGIFDGHSGDNCSEFLKNNLLNFIVEAKEFPIDIKESMLKGFQKAEEEFLKTNKGKLINALDNSGSCALIVIISDNKIYVANIGDSRAVLSLEGGNKIKPITIDHKPNNPKEYERIVKAGGKVFLDDDPKEESQIKFINSVKDFDLYCNDINSIFREYNSNMAVSRSIGDTKYKLKEYSGIPGSIICQPEIFILDYYNYYDFIVMGCDGIYDYLSNSQIIDSAWFIIKKLCKERNYDIHKLTEDACNMVIKYSLSTLAEDNLSCIIIGLDGLDKFLKTRSVKDKINNMSSGKKK